MLRTAPSSRVTARGLRALTRSLQAAQPMLLFALVLCFAASGCRHSEPHEREAQPRGPGAPATSSLPASMDMFDLRAHPNATILHPIDLKTLTESERKFGIAPKRGPKVEYQPDIILMEQGDKAIRSIGSDGMTWTFDANAPHVSEFQMGKIVFATGRAVGRIIYMKREGDDVKTILGPIQLTDVINKGEFAMSTPIDMNNVLVFTAPDLPEPREVAQKENASLPRKPWAGWDKTIVVSRISKNGKRTPVSMARTFADGQQMKFRRIGHRWVPENATPTVLTRTRAGYGSATPTFQRTAWSGQMVPGDPGLSMPRETSLPDYRVPSSANIPNIQIPNADLDAQPFATSGSIGVQYKYEKDGVSFVATGALELNNAHANFFMKFGGGKVPISAGLEIGGAVGVRLHLKAHTTADFHVNVQKKAWLPTQISIPLGGGVVPLSLTFDQALVLNTGFSAKNSILNAEGEYVFDGGIKAGLFDSDWAVNRPKMPKASVDIGKTTEGISVGINSLLMGAELRAMVGLGNQLFTTGVYATLIFTGTMLRAPDIGFPCRQGTIEVVLDSGVGYAIAPFIVDAINYVLSFVTDARVDRVGSILKGPHTGLFHGRTEIPGGCSSPKGGG
jgi:hypothetical protein